MLVVRERIVSVALSPSLRYLECSSGVSHSGRNMLTAKIETPGFYVVCEYYPPGNVVGNNNQFFKDNVLKQTKGAKTDTVESGVTNHGHKHNDARSLVGVVGIAAMVGFGIGV